MSAYQRPKISRRLLKVSKISFCFWCCTRGVWQTPARITPMRGPGSRGLSLWWSAHPHVAAPHWAREGGAGFCSNPPTFRGSLWPGLHPPLSDVPGAALGGLFASPLSPACLRFPNRGRDCPGGVLMGTPPPGSSSTKNECLHVYTMSTHRHNMSTPSPVHTAESESRSELPSFQWGCFCGSRTTARGFSLYSNYFFFLFSLCLLLLLVFIGPDGNLIGFYYS